MSLEVRGIPREIERAQNMLRDLKDILFELPGDARVPTEFFLFKDTVADVRAHVLKELESGSVLSMNRLVVDILEGECAMYAGYEPELRSQSLVNDIKQMLSEFVESQHVN